MKHFIYISIFLYGNMCYNHINKTLILYVSKDERGIIIDIGSNNNLLSHNKRRNRHNL